MANLEVIAERLLSILPIDGSQMPNHDVRTLLGRDLEAPITRETYFDVIELLERNGAVSRGRGRGGAVRRAQPQSVEQEASQRTVRERQLMPGLQRYLELRFWRRLELPDDAYWTVIDTSTGGARNGQWRRCDFAGVAIAPRAVLRGSDVEVYTFELKAEDSGNVDAVHEAHAQTRGSHYGYLVWHVRDQKAVRPRLTAVERECRELGIGLILFSDPQDLDAWDHRIPAAKQKTDETEIDRFLATRLDMLEIDTIRTRLGS